MKEEQVKSNNEKWLEVYKANYSGKSPEAKEVSDFLKETYNGASYIPWATMERLTYMQDPTAEFKTILTSTGNIVHTDGFMNENSVANKDTINTTKAMVVSHFVKVACIFMGRTFIEEYPIQDQDYSALKIYNQNAVNKALKRALAKVASRATGIGLKLYENKDLQFDEKEEEKKPEIKKTTTKSTIKKEEPKVEEKVVEVKEEPKIEEKPKQDVVEVAQEVLDLCNLIKNSDKEKMVKILQNLNTPILKQHGFTLSLDDSDEVLCEKLSHFQDVSVFTRAITNMLG